MQGKIALCREGREGEKKRQKQSDSYGAFEWQLFELFPPDSGSSKDGDGVGKSALAVTC